jgi:hypothetical protein
MGGGSDANFAAVPGIAAVAESFGLGEGTLIRRARNIWISIRSFPACISWPGLSRVCHRFTCRFIDAWVRPRVQGPDL